MRNSFRSSGQTHSATGKPRPLPRKGVPTTREHVPSNRNQIPERSKPRPLAREEVPARSTRVQPAARNEPRAITVQSIARRDVRVALRRRSPSLARHPVTGTAGLVASCRDPLTGNSRSVCITPSIDDRAFRSASSDGRSADGSSPAAGRGVVPAHFSFRPIITRVVPPQRAAATARRTKTTASRSLLFGKKSNRVGRGAGGDSHPFFHPSHLRPAHSGVTTLSKWN